MSTTALDPAWILPAWDAPANVRGFMTTRAGGVSAGAFATLNLALTGAEGDDAGAVAENRRRVGARTPAAPVWLNQVHGADVVTLDARSRASACALPPTADAAVTREPGVPLAVLVADCLPVFFADRAGSVIGIAHAGWRGLAAGVLEAALAALRVAPSDVAAWLGPSIGPRAFEVGRDVRDAMTAVDAGAAACFAPICTDKWLADLPGLARRRLSRAGVTAIATHGGCTWSEPGRYFSFRRERTTGRMAAILWLKPEGGGPVRVCGHSVNRP